jgi:signal transduction histidine kinase/ActR/RegA family two-component response regulator
VDFTMMNPFKLMQESLEQQNSQFQVMLQVSRILNSTLDLEILLGTIVEVAAQVTDTEAASILLLDETSGELHFEAATGGRRVEVQTVIVPLQGSIAGWIIQHDQPLIVNDAHNDPRHFDQADRTTHFDTQSILGVPLKVKDKTIGVIEILNKRNQLAFSKRDIEILETLADQAATAIENARLYKDLQDQMRARQETQARLVQTEKLAAIGELVAGVAHELNNPLTSIIGFAELMQAEEIDERSAYYLKKIAAQGQRAAGIVRNLLDFARQRPAERKPVQINEVIKSALDLFAYELGRHNVVFHTYLLAELPLTMADPYKLQQVFVNLIRNAYQAMAAAHGGGQLTVTTWLAPPTYLAQRQQRAPAQPARESVIRIEVRDDGPGITTAHLSRIFDPFFTTKRPGEGTGLGLSVCHGIIHEHNGHIWAESELGHGATFFIELPPLVPQYAPRQVKPERMLSPDFQLTFGLAHAPARILLVDDDVDVLAVLVQTLQNSGFQVDAVSDGKVALACVAAIDYDLIICDIRMPGLDGLDVYQRMRSSRADLAQRFIFVTGDTISPVTHHFLEESRAAYLSKPFKPTALLEKVQAMLQPTPLSEMNSNE